MTADGPESACLVSLLFDLLSLCSENGEETTKISYQNQNLKFKGNGFCHRLYNVVASKALSHCSTQCIYSSLGFVE